jgi:Fe-S-cluster containining protein
MLLPCNECGGQCCTFPVFTDSELQLVRLTRGIPEGTLLARIPGGTVIHRPGGTCPYLLNGKCSIHSIRPQVCRDYGVVPELPCAYLYKERAQKLQAERLKRLEA